MNMYDIILKKREGGVLTDEEIQYFITGYTEGTIPDYQASALLMAILWRGLNHDETYQLTRCMKYSGDVVDLSGIDGIKVDKHSTGGVGDKTTLIVAPLAAACGVKIAKMSGRGLGFTGGTVDKMESIPGFRVALEPEEFFRQVNEVGMAVIGQTAHVAPADKKLYALRDVTATVDNLSLITSSIMSKKLACGSDAIVLDIKCGNGAFMKTEEMAKELAGMMCEIGAADGKKTVGVITDMEQPLGRAVGNALEVIEAIEVLKGHGPADIEELALTLSGIMIHLGGHAKDAAEGHKMAEEAMRSGRALEVFRKFVKAQGGNPAIVDDYKLLPQHSCELQVKAKKSGFVTQIEAMRVGLASQHSGAGRATKEDSIDLSAGIYLNKKVGDQVAEGELLATVYGNDQAKVKLAADELEQTFIISEKQGQVPKLIKATIGL